MKLDNKEKKGFKRGAETMFRTLAANHQRLGEMADTKSHIMITVNSIILLVVITVLLGHIEKYPHFAIPAVLLLNVNLIALIFAVLAARPRIPNGKVSPGQVDQGKINLMFFGNFYEMNATDYADHVQLKMKNSIQLYKSLMEDIHVHGIVLSKKYKLLRMSYNVFMIGIACSVISFILASLPLWT